MMEMVLLSLSFPRDEQMATNVILASTCARKYVHDNFCRDMNRNSVHIIA